MSNYSRKHPHHADCASPGCEKRATTLRLLHGAPWWLCPEHAAQLSPSASGMR